MLHNSFVSKVLNNGFFFRILVFSLNFITWKRWILCVQDFRPTLHSIVSGRSHNRSGLKRLPEISQVPVDTLSYPTQYQFLNQTTLDLRKEKWTFLNREFTVVWLLISRSILIVLCGAIVGYLIFL